MAEEKHTVEVPQQSPRFNASDADVYFRSADNVLFDIHRKNLEVTTGAFPPSGFSTQGEIVPLSEHSETLGLMFQYIYPMSQPDVSLLPFETLALLAEAAEKYQVFPATFVCKTYMRQFINTHPHKILEYAVKHGYKDLVEEAAPLLLVMPFKEALVKLPENLVAPWARYYSSWDSILRLARSLHSDPAFSSQESSQMSRGAFSVPQYTNIDRVLCDVMKKLDDVKSLRKLDDVFKQPILASPDVAKQLDKWRRLIEREVATIQPFTTYV